MSFLSWKVDWVRCSLRRRWRTLETYWLPLLSSATKALLSVCAMLSSSLKCRRSRRCCCQVKAAWASSYTSTQHRRILPARGSSRWWDLPFGFGPPRRLLGCVMGLWHGLLTNDLAYVVLERGRRVKTPTSNMVHLAGSSWMISVITVMEALRRSQQRHNQIRDIIATFARSRGHTVFTAQRDSADLLHGSLLLLQSDPDGGRTKRPIHASDVQIMSLSGMHAYLDVWIYQTKIGESMLDTLDGQEAMKRREFAMRVCVSEGSLLGGGIGSYFRFSLLPWLPAQTIPAPDVETDLLLCESVRERQRDRERERESMKASEWRSTGLCQQACRSDCLAVDQEVFHEGSMPVVCLGCQLVLRGKDTTKIWNSTNHVVTKV